MAKVMVVGANDVSLIHFRGKLIEEMVSCGHEVVACAPQVSLRIRDKLATIGAGYRNFPLQRTGINPLQDLRSLWAFIEMFREFKPDIVLPYTIKPAIYGSIGASIARVANVSSMITGLGYAFSTESFKQRFIGQITTLLFRIALRRNKVVFFQNPDDLELFHNLGIIRERNHPTLINGSGVDLDFFKPQPFPETISFLLIARFIVEKGLREYADAARIIRDKYPHVRFRLVGMVDSNPSAITPRELESWEKAGIINCLGQLEDVRPTIADSSVYVLPSYYREGVPRTCLEAMAMARPIITTNAPGCRETVIDGSNGFLIPIKNIDALVAAMERFIQKPEMIPLMGAASRRLAEERFDVHRVNKVILNGLELLR